MRDAVTGPAVVTVKDASGRVVSEGTTTLLSTNIAVDLKTGLAQGVYTVTYRIEGSKTKGPEGGVFQFAYGAGSPQKDISTWAGYKDIPKETRLPDDAKREAAFEAASKDKDKDDTTSSATPGAPSADGTNGTDPANTADETEAADSSGGSAWLWLVLIALALGGGGAAAYVALRRRGAAAPGDHGGATTAPRPDDEA